MRIVVDGQKLADNLRASKDLLVMVKSLAKTLNWQTSYQPNKETIYVSTTNVNPCLIDGDENSTDQDELESLRLQDKIICIDAGHGGEDFGAMGPKQTMEKDNNLAIALNLQQKLEANGATVIMTRTTDHEVSYHKVGKREELCQRVTLANDTNADIFVSIHNDSFSNHTNAGTTTFYYDEKSYDLASMIQNCLVNEIHTINRGVRFASFYVIRYTSMPAVLVEAAFISNPEEELFLASNDGREKVAEGIYQGIVHYFKV